MNPSSTITYVFSFGFNHRHPVTGQDLSNRFVEIPGATPEHAREEMLRRFGTRWGFQYTDRKEAQCERFELRPLEGDLALGKAAASSGTGTPS